MTTHLPLLTARIRSQDDGDDETTLARPKVEWDMSEQDALDILAMVSLVHRKLDMV